MHATVQGGWATTTQQQQQQHNVIRVLTFGREGVTEEEELTVKELLRCVIDCIVT